MKRYFTKRVTIIIALLVCSLLAPHKSFAFQVKEGAVTIVVTPCLPESYTFIPGAPSTFECLNENPDIVELPKNMPKKYDPLFSSYRMSLITKPGSTFLTFKAHFHYCSKTSRMCFQNDFKTRVTLEVKPKGSSTVFFLWDIKPKQ